MGFFLAKVGILPETVETKDEELRKVISVISRGSLQWNWLITIIMAQLLIPQALLSLHALG